MSQIIRKIKIYKNIYRIIKISTDLSHLCSRTSHKNLVNLNDRNMHCLNSWESFRDVSYLCSYSFKIELIAMIFYHNSLFLHYMFSIWFPHLWPYYECYYSYTTVPTVGQVIPLFKYATLWSPLLLEPCYLAKQFCYPQDHGY